uniref:HYPK_UBA domain-containing protein n=1 Tax=Globodera pallida TaxID=36090 RepID=A0A183BUG3_GLOPA
MSSKKNDVENDANDEIEGNNAEAESSQLKNRWDADAANLEKVTDFQEEKDEMNEISKESLGNLKAQPGEKRFTVRKEDVQTIVEELEVSRVIAERKLIQHEGSLRAALLDLMGFELNQ